MPPDLVDRFLQTYMIKDPLTGMQATKILIQVPDFGAWGKDNSGKLFDLLSAEIADMDALESEEALRFAAKRGHEAVVRLLLNLTQKLVPASFSVDNVSDSIDLTRIQHLDYYSIRYSTLH